MAEAAKGERKRVAMRIREGGTHIVEPSGVKSSEAREAAKPAKVKDEPDTNPVEQKEGAK